MTVSVQQHLLSSDCDGGTPVSSRSEQVKCLLPTDVASYLLGTDTNR